MSLKHWFLARMDISINSLRIIDLRSLVGRCLPWAFIILGLVLMHEAHAQESSGSQKKQSTVYVCTNNNVTVLRNTPPTAIEPSKSNACVVKIMVTRVDINRIREKAQPIVSGGVPIYPRAWSDPQPTSQTLIVGAQVPPEVQWQRDVGRQRILRAELSAAEQRLVQLQSEYRDGEPERMGSEKNYQKYLDRVADLKQNIRLTEANIAALRRELNTVGIQP